MGALQPGHIIVILVVALILFGPSRLPEMGRSLGQGIREFKGAALALTEDPQPQEESNEGK